MSMKFAGRDFKKNPLTRADTQIYFDPDNQDEAPYRAQQHHNADRKLDSAAIMSRFFTNGVITHTRTDSSRYIDATHVNDFREAMTIQAKADQAFNSIPEGIRGQFATKEDFVSFAIDPSNLDKLREWGLAPFKYTPAPAVVEAPAEPSKPA